ncbi:MAG: hypothetical protein HY317_05810 [Acidobacteria bacterium]|nr:hypothetical protein [Acidobacteriota bacterium]
MAMLLGAFAGCDWSSTSSPTAAPPTPTPAPSAAPVSPPPPTAPAPQPSPVANRRPVGDFKFTPAPDADGFLSIDVATSVRVNGSEFHDPDGDRLYLTVDWGDGDGNHIQCGTCRLQHEYRKLGRFVLVASISDLRATVRRTVKVRVR